MPNIIRRTVRNIKRRIRVGLQEQRTYLLYQACGRMLASQDYEQISVAKLAKEAGCSVGAFYSRFHDKDRFLHFVISSRFRNATDAINRDITAKETRKESAQKIVRCIVEHVVERLSSRTAAGVTRAALKLATTKPEALEPLLRYRSAVTERAVELLDDLPARSVRMTMQTVLATVTDSVLQNAGPLRAGSARMVDALSDLMIVNLGLMRTRGTLSADKREDDADDDANGGPAERRNEVWDPEAPELEETPIPAGERRRSRRRHRRQDEEPTPGSRRKTLAARVRQKRSPRMRIRGGRDCGLYSIHAPGSQVLERRLLSAKAIRSRRR